MSAEKLRFVLTDRWDLRLKKKWMVAEFRALTCRPLSNLSYSLRLSTFLRQQQQLVGVLERQLAWKLRRNRIWPRFHSQTYLCGQDGLFLQFLFSSHLSWSRRLSFLQSLVQLCPDLAQHFSQTSCLWFGFPGYSGFYCIQILVERLKGGNLWFVLCNLSLGCAEFTFSCLLELFTCLGKVKKGSSYSKFRLTSHTCKTKEKTDLGYSWKYV